MNTVALMGLGGESMDEHKTTRSEAEAVQDLVAASHKMLADLKDDPIMVSFAQLMVSMGKPLAVQYVGPPPFSVALKAH
jgi:hypothetical protein